MRIPAMPVHGSGASRASIPVHAGLMCGGVVRVFGNGSIVNAYFTPCRATVSHDAGAAFHRKAGHRFTHAGTSAAGISLTGRGCGTTG
jgi:hypothetical protein